MKRTILLLMALLIGILLPLQSTQSRVDPWVEGPWDRDPGDDHPWGGDDTDPGGLRIQPGVDYGYIHISFIGRIVNYTMPLIFKLYTKGQTAPAPVTRRISQRSATNSTSSRTIQMSGGK